MPLNRALVGAERNGKFRHIFWRPQIRTITVVVEMTCACACHIHSGSHTSSSSARRSVGRSVGGAVSQPQYLYANPTHVGARALANTAVQHDTQSTAVRGGCAIALRKWRVAHAHATRNTLVSNACCVLSAVSTACRICNIYTHSFISISMCCIVAHLNFATAMRTIELDLTRADEVEAAAPRRCLRRCCGGARVSRGGCLLVGRMPMT